jgi:hypothetical protein
MALNQPEGVACSDQYFVVADTGNRQLVRYSITDQTMVPDVTFPLEKISPMIAEINTKGEIYLLDGKTRTVIKVSQNGQVKGRIVPKGVTGSKTYMPRSFKLDEDDNLYLLDIFAEPFSDLAINDQGSIYLLNGVSGAIYVAIPGTEAFELMSDDLKEHMNFPTNLAIDSNGVLYLSDQYGSGLALVGRDGTFQGRKFGMGWEEGQLYYPSQLCINDQETLFIADKNNSRVQVFNILND